MAASTSMTAQGIMFAATAAAMTSAVAEFENLATIIRRRFPNQSR